jgi:hypothetical protein
MVSNANKKLCFSGNRIIPWWAYSGDKHHQYFWLQPGTA